MITVLYGEYHVVSLIISSLFYTHYLLYNLLPFFIGSAIGHVLGLGFGLLLSRSIVSLIARLINLFTDSPRSLAC